MDATSSLGTVQLAATSLYVSDLDAAVAWYEAALGLRPMTVGADEHRYASYVLGGAIVVLEPRVAALEPGEPGGGSTTVNLLVERDPAEVHAELVGRGVRCGAIVDSPNYSSFLMRDPDGNRFYVSRPTTPGARDAVSTATPTTP